MNKTVLYKITIVLIAVVLSACASYQKNDDDEGVPKSLMVEFKGDPNQKKSIFVFLDGTANDTSSETNILRLYRVIESSRDKQVGAKYIQGVGTVENPEFTSSKSGGLVFGQGMESRIKVGYDYLAKNYAPGDDIYIFGFSRGAHEARSLAGFLSYVGLPVKTEKSTKFGTKEWNRILEITKEQSDIDYASHWNSWTPGQMPPLAGDARKELGVEFQPVQVTLLGIWDTVPGSSFVDYGDGACKQQIGPWKKYFHWLPIISKGERYKSDSYPSIRSIAHAVSIDEKRNKFKPLLLCPANYPADQNLRPHLIEKWFPGAHADVGGGYSDGKNDLPNISLNWMVEILAQSYSFPTRPERFHEDPNGLAHWSVGDMSEIPGMHCEDRPAPPSDAKHESASLRTGRPLIRVKGKVKNYPYSIQCADEKSLIDAS